MKESDKGVESMTNEELEMMLQEKCEAREDRRIAYRQAKSTNIFKHWWYFGHFKKEVRWEKAPCDKVEYHFFKKRIRQIEREGIRIWRDWFFVFAEKFPLDFHLYTRPEFSWRNLFRTSAYKYTFPWECTDIDDYLIVKLTIVGMMLFRHGHCICDREIAHRIWEVREKLIKAYYENEWSLGPDNTDMLKEVYAIIGKEHLNWWD